MASIDRVSIHSFRNISTMQLALVPGVQVLCGDNGAGKTSLLEALYCLVYGKSFRSLVLEHCIAHGHEGLAVTAQLRMEVVRQVSFKKIARRAKVFQLDGVAQKSQLDFAHQVPLLFINTDAHRLFFNTPAVRRRLIDWLVFHVKPSFLTQWRQYQKGLRHYNCLLKQGGAEAELDSWLEVLEQTSIVIDQQRQALIAPLEVALLAVWQALGQTGRLSCGYQRGWPEDQSLREAALARRGADRGRGFLSVGPHKFDFHLYKDDCLVQQIMSEGQFKLLSYAVRLAHAALLDKEVQKESVIMIDDLPAELDSRGQRALMDYFCQGARQVIVSCIDGRAIDSFRDRVAWFHVKQGEVCGAD
jgi:DNA replication and repair protein RecF